ncbi:MAG TPA: hypothetical protein VFA07_13735 [Chthonomonadaceae bacterium]|nr:hypothetical protein [Chthonomonadaceae bacterium]
MGRLRKFVRKSPYIFGKILAEMWQMFVGYLVGLTLEMLFLLLVGLAVVTFIVLPIPALLFSLASGGVYAHQRAQQRRRVSKPPVCEEPEERVLLRAADRSARDRATLLRSIAAATSGGRDELLRAGMLDLPLNIPAQRGKRGSCKPALALLGFLLAAFALGTGMGYVSSPQMVTPVTLPAYHRIPHHAYQGKLIQDVGAEHTKTSRGAPSTGKR